MYQLSQIADVIRGVSFAKSEGSNEPAPDRIPVIRAGSIQESLLLEEGQIWVPTTKVKEHQKIRRNDIVMCTSSGSADLVGKCAISPANFEGSFGAFCAGIRPDPNKVSPSYLFHFLSSPVFRSWTRNSSGANIKNIRISELAAFEIPLPPLEEQKRIAAILDKADAIRRKRQQAIQLADDLLQSVFLEMFGDSTMNPHSWETMVLEDLITSGPSNGLYKPASDYGAGARILRIDGFYSGALVPQERLKRVRLSEAEVAKYSLEERSIVVNRVNSREYLGKTALIEDLDEVTVFESNMMNFSVNENVINARYLTSLMQTPFFRGQILNSSKDAVNQSSINQQDVKSFLVRVPPLEAQLKFETIFKRVKRDMSQSMGANRNLVTELFNSISYQVFNAGD